MMRQRDEATRVRVKRWYLVRTVMGQREEAQAAGQGETEAPAEISR